MNQTKPTNNAFLSMMGELRKGMAVSELSDSLAEVVKCCRDTGKKGTLTLKMEFIPSSGGETCLVTCEHTTKEPQKEKTSTTFFTTDDNLLVRNDPHQRELFNVVVGQQPEAAQPQASTAS